MTARSDAQALHERKPATALEADLDYCDNVFGVSPCTAGLVNTGTLQSGGTTTVRLAAGASAVDDAYNGMTLRSTGGTGSGQERKIIDYVGATRDATVAIAFSPALDGTTTYDVIDRPNACYNVFTGDSPCQDTANFVKGVKTIKFWTRGARIPAGEQLRPYITKATPTPTEIKPDKGLAARSHTTVDLIDEPARDDLDKYVDDRAAPAGGTFWPRVLARNPNAIGRFARLRKGYVLEPFDWNAFQTELYVIEAIRGPDRQGEVSFVLSDAVKLLDRTKIPVPTDGKLLADLAATSDAGTARGGTLNTIVLREKASAVDDFYNDQEVHILENTGAGQRLVISDYDGATRTATLSTNWQVIPDTLSVYEIAPLGFTMEDGKGAQYPDPATSGKPEFFRIGDEVIRYTAKASDTLSWADGSYRAQFGTARDEHKTKDGVQLCRAWIDVPAATVLKEIINEGGLVDAYIDLVQLAAEADDWLKGVANITACISDPETASELFADLLKDVNLMSWWHPVEQKVKFKADMPALASSVPELTDNTLMLRATVAERLDAERITRAAINYDLVSTTEDRKRWVNYRTAQIFIDQAAEGPNGYNDVRQDLRQSRWLTEPNELLAKANTHRKVLRYRDTPSKIRVQLDPRDEVQLGDLRDLTTRKLTDAAGNPKTVRCRVVRVVDHGGHFEADLRTTTFNKRYGFIAPAGQANYGAASDAEKVYAYISNGAAMSDGTSAYLIS